MYAYSKEQAVHYIFVLLLPITLCVREIERKEKNNMEIYTGERKKQWEGNFMYIYVIVRYFICKNCKTYSFDSLKRLQVKTNNHM